MREGADAARRRELQRRAFAPGGRLTEAEAEELRALEDRARAVAPAVPHVESSTSPDEDDDGADNTASPMSGQVGDPTADALRASAARSSSAGDAEPVVTETEAAQEKGRLRRLSVVLVAVIAVIAGVLLGRFALPADDSRAMTAEQRDAWAKLEASDRYDPGSLRLIGSQEGADVWTATRTEGKLFCVVVTYGEADPADGCAASEEGGLEQGMGVSLHFEEDGADVLLWASVAEDLAGEPVVIVQREEDGGVWDWRSAYSEEELAVVEMLEAAGYDGELLQFIGYDGDTTVWLSSPPEGGAVLIDGEPVDPPPPTEQSCLLVAAGESITSACRELRYDSGDFLDVTANGATYRVTAVPRQGFLLTVYRDAVSGSGA